MGEESCQSAFSVQKHQECASRAPASTFERLEFRPGATLLSVSGCQIFSETSITVDFKSIRIVTKA